MTTVEGKDGLDQATDSTEIGVRQSNFERLIPHLRKGSLAEKLVSAYASADEGNTAQAIKAVMTARLNEIKREYDGPEDQKN